MNHLRATWMGRAATLLLCGALAASATESAAPAQPVSNKDAVITSNSLHLEKGGQETLFKGNALLTQVQQWIKADEITRYRLTGIAEAHGHVRGTWFSPQGEKVIGTGERARYNPITQTTDLWSKKGLATLTRWETVRDTEPVVIHAVHFTAKQTENVMLAHDKVVIIQAPRFEGHSDEARYNRTAGTLEMWGDKQVFVHLNDGKGAGDFTADRAWMLLTPRRARLTGNVKGHVIPSEAAS